MKKFAFLDNYNSKQCQSFLCQYKSYSHIFFARFLKNQSFSSLRMYNTGLTYCDDFAALLFIVIVLSTHLHVKETLIWFDWVKQIPDQVEYCRKREASR